MVLLCLPNLTRFWLDFNKDLSKLCALSLTPRILVGLKVIPSPSKKKVLSKRTCRMKKVWASDVLARLFMTGPTHPVAKPGPFAVKFVEMMCRCWLTVYLIFCGTIRAQNILPLTSAQVWRPPVGDSSFSAENQCLMKKLNINGPKSHGHHLCDGTKNILFVRISSSMIHWRGWSTAVHPCQSLISAGSVAVGWELWDRGAAVGAVLPNCQLCKYWCLLVTEWNTGKYPYRFRIKYVSVPENYACVPWAHWWFLFAVNIAECNVPSNPVACCELGYIVWSVQCGPRGGARSYSCFRPNVEPWHVP